MRKCGAAVHEARQAGAAQRCAWGSPAAHLLRAAVHWRLCIALDAAGAATREAIEKAETARD